MTIEQVKQDIASGKCHAIYYSSGTLWWTHLDDDVAEATKQGRERLQKRHDSIMNNPAISDDDKKRVQQLFNLANSSPFPIPTDPTGAPLFEYTDPVDINKWISEAEKKPEHFGRHGLRAFMRTHHQNSNNQFARDWAHINNFIDLSDTVN